jgi:hypothetical protein
VQASLIFRGENVWKLLDEEVLLRFGCLRCDRVRTYTGRTGELAVTTRFLLRMACSKRVCG